jgi:hypothetical protein
MIRRALAAAAFTLGAVSPSHAQPLEKATMAFPAVKGEVDALWRAGLGSRSSAV